MKLKTMPQAVVRTLAIIGCQPSETRRASKASSKARKAIPLKIANSMKRRRRVFSPVVLKTQVMLAQKLKMVEMAKAIALATTDFATSSAIGKTASMIAKMIQLIAVLVQPTMKNLASCWKVLANFERCRRLQPQATKRSIISPSDFFDGFFGEVSDELLGGFFDGFFLADIVPLL